MQQTYRAGIVQRSLCWSCGLVVVLLALLFTGCTTCEDTSLQKKQKNPFDDEIRQLDSVNAAAVAEVRTQQGNWNFLACYTDDPPTMHVPGLIAEEGVEYVDSERFATEVYFDHRMLCVFQFDGDPQPWVEAKWRYAEKVNRALVRKIRDTGRISALISGPAPSTQPANK